MKSENILHTRCAFCVALLLLGAQTSLATTFLQFDSTYLGDGWFQYRMDVMNDPFFTEADVTGLGITFTNQIDASTTSPNWTNRIDPNQSYWSSPIYPPTRQANTPPACSSHVAPG